MRRIYWDTMMYAYWFENHKNLGDRVQHIYKSMQRRGDVLCSSLFVLSELLVGPLRTHDEGAARLIEEYFSSSAITMLTFVPKAARLFAHLRAEQHVKPLDALHLAIAASSGVDLFLTNDRRLHHVVVPDLPFIASLETDLF
jgi:predicted nucleic acid-binding protein